MLSPRRQPLWRLIFQQVGYFQQLPPAFKSGFWMYFLRRGLCRDWKSHCEQSLYWAVAGECQPLLGDSSSDEGQNRR